ncbi:hypothetical protein BFJ72_g14826 [Fusarium proliferatum]|uniref:ubiquitinyl hydrolase 1 n=1 Tax=Gibberella intermedia TaxID=948311 RepID=A0A420RWW5_GIBIN|nr:hypothetical protein BFJ72_g14826 [Fusarium proliferatum]
MIEIQRWLERSCRDVLDESDFTLSPKTQLIYPSGIPMMLDGHPQRWKVVEDLLLLVENHVPHLQSEFSDGVEIVRRHHGYPILHFLRDEAEKALSELLIDDICRGRLPQLKFKSTANSSAQRDVGLIVSGADVDPLTWQRAAESLTDDIFGLKSLYLLRGLISQRLLLTCLKKRWNVQYGLHPQRAPIAVPFEAKGVPSPTAEYGHPDTSLVLTCLAFYQTGLTKSQVTQCLQHILRSDDPPTQYERLVSGCKLPAHLEHWNLLNADDDIQIEELWGSLRLDTTVVNYFLNNFAFPAHAKQFGVKLQTSGWDIPLLSSDETSKNLTTGFSGTNNNKRMLPQTIKQDDLPSLVQTNAEVLSYLLEPRSQRCYQAIDRNGRHLTERGLLELLRREQIRVLIDAGAHVLEMSNDQLAAAWLDIYNDAQGAVYFDSNSRIMVHARFQKVPVPLLASPFAENLEQCVVYIDEAHTRGTDLKLPVHARGAVTLGLGQTKDHTVQAAMRLRQLGSTQSVAFIVPPEVYRNVLDLRPDKDRTCSPVTSTDVVYWLLEQSCKANENMMSLHTAQGFDFCQRTNALWKYPNSINRPGERIPLLDAIQKREDRTLEQLYGPRQTVSINEAVDQLEFDRLKLFASTLCQQKLNLPRDHPSAFQEVELQREVEFEFEQVRDKQKPTKFTALKFHGLEPAILHFVNTGHLQEGENFVQAFDFLSRTKLGRKQTETALIVIPEEAELLLPTLRNTSRAGVCLVTYAAPIAKSMRQFNAMTYFTVPTPDKSQSLPKWLCIEIGVIAGRLYFDYSEYPSLVAWLGTSQETGPPNDIPNEFSQETASVTRGLIVDEPLNFLLEWLAHRRQTMDLTHTPMGYVCQGRNLHSDHPFFASATTSRVSDEAYHDVQSDAVNNHTGRATGSSDDDSDWGLTDEEEMALPTSLCITKHDDPAANTGKGSLQGLLSTNSFVERWNQKYRQNRITFWDQDIRRQCPAGWISKIGDDGWILVYRDDAPGSLGLNNVLKGPTTLDCGMCIPLAHVFAKRYMLGDKWFDRSFQFKQQEFALTQTWSESRCGNTKNLLFPLYEECLAGSPPPIIRNKTVWNLAEYESKHPGGYGRLQNIIQIEDLCIVFSLGSSSTFLSESELDEKMMQDHNASQDDFDIEQLNYLQCCSTVTRQGREGKSSQVLFEECKRYASHTVSRSEWDSTKAERAQKSVEMMLDFERLHRCLVAAREAYEKAGEDEGETVLTRALAMKMTNIFARWGLVAEASSVLKEGSREGDSLEDRNR